jgi:DNA helicase II / ATP-dependent DNA helicase PcrA
VASERVRTLLAERWPLIICDEFQDTSDDQWQLLQRLGEQSRLLLLADPNQMIYTFLPGVGPRRLQQAGDLADRVVELEPASHRDPSGAISALALSIMKRDFGSAPVRDAVASGRLRVRVAVDDDELVDTLRQELKLAWLDGARDFGIFGHSNEGVSTLGHELSEAGIDHVLVGLPDAQGEAIAVMAVMCQFAVGVADSRALRVALATFLTACTRGSRPPELAVALSTGQPIPKGLEDRLAQLERALVDAAPDPVEVGRVIEQSWPALGILSGNRPWSRASPAFGPVLRRATRARLLVDSSRMRLPPTKLMNFHQTKGREADAVLLVYREGDVLAGWRDSEPYVESSRVLYVSLSRARQRVTVILPGDPHPLVAPFEELAS